MMNTAVPDASAARLVTRLMQSDAVLSAGVAPAAEGGAAGDAALVTGATGFLGRYLVSELLQRPGLEIVCLVRAASVAEGKERLRAALLAAGVELFCYRGRIRVMVGAIDRPHLGLTPPAYAALSARIGSIYHCAAEVNWARSYRRLRGSNVLGTLELIRFASHGALKRLCFSSTIAVCFATPGPDRVDEATDMLPHVAHMPLPYAQSKCVAESLLRQAASRGVPVSVVRPALISGHSESGDANPGDLIAALVAGCVASGAAIDSDWLLDCVPVDFVARVIATLGDSPRPQWEVLNLFNEHSRHWREIVLWMNLYGYPVELVSHADWVRRTFARATAPPELFGYRRFFGAVSNGLAGRAPYETYLEQSQGRVDNRATQRTLAALDLHAPALNGALMERYLGHYAAAGLMPRPGRGRVMGSQRRAADATLREAIGEWLSERQLTLLNVREIPLAAHNGIFNEIASARVGRQIGIRRYELQVQEQQRGGRHALGVLLKTKPSDTLMEDVLVEVATLCDPALGESCAAFKGDLGLAGCHERELALYELQEPRLRRYTPAVLGTGRDSGRGTWSIAMEYLVDAETVDVAGTRWTPTQLAAVIRGLAAVHGIWYQQDGAPTSMPWVTLPPDTARMLTMMPLWSALAEHSRRYFSAWLPPPVLALQKQLIANLGDWWPALRTLRQTLVHNDCNPRNLVLRHDFGPALPSFFDWELATVGVPQHDLAELLCFVLPPGCSSQTLSDALELHRAALEQASGVAIDPDRWLLGFRLSLRYLFIYRLPLYTVMHRFKRQVFLPRVLRSWAHLYELSAQLSRRPAATDGVDAYRSRGGRRAKPVPATRA
jgi:thioester reductase-like protein